MSKQFLGIIAVVIIIFVGIFALTGNKSNNGSKSSSTGKAGTLTHHVQGQGQSGVTLQEWGDYECPYCGQYAPIVKQVQQEFDKQITYQFSNFPLISIHQNAMAGARAAEAAGLEGKFWEMHDMLYASQNQWSTASDPTSFFDAYAQQLGLNVNTFKTDYASSQVNDLIQADLAKANKLGLTGTPTFYLDGKQVQVGQSVQAFEQVINAEIAKKTAH